MAIFTIEYLARLLTVTAVPSAYEAAYISKFGFKASPDGDVPMFYPLTPHGIYRCLVAAVVKIAKFIFSPLNVIDFIAIVPYYINLASDTNLGGSLVILRVLRLARILRLFKMSKRMEGVQVLARTLQVAADAMGFLLFFVVLAVVLFGSIIFFCEVGDWDDASQTFLRPNLTGTGTEASPFRSIPHAFWWTIVTMTVSAGFANLPAGHELWRCLGHSCRCRHHLPRILAPPVLGASPGLMGYAGARPTLSIHLHSNPIRSDPSRLQTVGYGDFYPTTNAGRTIASFIMLTGILVLALPITVIGWWSCIEHLLHMCVSDRAASINLHSFSLRSEFHSFTPCR